MMQTVWFILVAFMLTAYVVLDGFDLGAGALHLIAARTNEERRLLLRSIGPVWDGNEVWLLAAGGTLFYAFPLLYASSFSGFYLPLCMVLWLLVLRAISIEFRAHLDNSLWRDFFDGLLSIASLLLLVLFGAALGNVIRGVPLGKDHYFFVPLWTNFSPGPDPGALDWYTALCALMAVAAAGLHGALYVVMKTTGPLRTRMAAIANRLWLVVAIGTVAGLAATMAVRPRVLDNYRAAPAGWLIPAAVVAALGAIRYCSSRGGERNAFLFSCAYLTAMLTGAAFALYPTLLPSGNDPALSLTIWNSSAGPSSLSIGLIWWSIGMGIAIGYFILVYTMFRGKVDSSGDGHY
ncbi:MAG TPA: cytochrome d ubiquinol oxidase subunit II [Bryobacteraceae bacterium]|nr:cytochrome d ubiquinol oxidase subunit II [Bryobacteraceae bacterium]